MFKFDIPPCIKFYEDIYVSYDGIIEKVKTNPNNYIYSKDGVHWEEVPYDISLIPKDSFFHIKPKNIFIGNEKFKENKTKINPNEYEFSCDNGTSWNDVQLEKNISSCNWVYHNSHKFIWFRKKR